MHHFIAAIFAAILAYSPAHAQTGSAKTPAALNAEVNALFPDQNAGGVTPFDARQTFLDIIASYAALTNNPVNGPVSSLAGNIVTWNNGTGSLLADSGINLASLAANVRTKLPTGVTPFYANSSGTGCGGAGCLDTNDGLTTLTAKKTVLGAVYGILNKYDFTCNDVTQSTAQINLLANETNAGETLHFGPHDYVGACAGGSVIIDGAGTFTYEYDSASSAAIAVFFGPAFQLQNITLANSSGICVGLFEHASIRYGAGVVFGNCLTGMQAQSLSVATFLNNFTISTNTTVSTFITAQEGSLVTFGSGITANVSANPTYSVAMFVADHSGINMNSLSWSGNAPTGSKYAIVDGGAIFNGASSIPAGGAGTTASGGTVDGAAMAVSAGGTGNTGTAWTLFTPTFTCGTATVTTGTARSKTLGKTTWAELDFTITAIGTCTTPITFTLPNTAFSSGSINGINLALSGVVACTIAPSSATGTCIRAGGAAFAVNDHVVASGVYENQ